MQIDSPKLQHPSAFQHSTVSNAHPASSLFTSSNMAGTTLASSPSPASTRPSPAQDRDHTQSAKYRGIELPGGHGGKAAGAPESVPQAKHEESDDMQNSSAGPVRTQKGQKSLSDEKNSKAIAAPVKSACTFCRSR